MDHVSAPPVSRVLELLELLQTRSLLSGQEIAERLGVDRRTVRRDVLTLQRLGIPVEGTRGIGGGYRLRPGYRLPPLMLSDDEAAAIVLGLTAAHRLGLGDAGAALAKIHRVLPEAVRRRVGALEAALAFTTPATDEQPPALGTALLLADAIQHGRRVRATYRSHGDARTDRELSPYGLVVHAGRWYLAAHDETRGATRTFRVDRLAHVTVSGTPARAAPEDFDARRFVSGSLARVPWQWEIEVRLDLPLAEARRRVPDTLAVLAAENDGTVLRMWASSLDWAASLLAGLGCPFRVRQPPELRERVRALAQRLADC